MGKNLVSIIVCTKNEINNLDNCIRGILNFELPENVDYELIFVDGKSTDGTYEKIKKIANLNDKVSLIKNEKIFQVFGINKGVDSAKGDYILWLSGHTMFPKNYLKILLKSAEESNADYTGGIVETIPWDSSYSASVVQAISTHKFGVGDSNFRIGGKFNNTADTASFGLFKRELFHKIGIFDERLIRCQDYEFNARIRKNGGIVWLNSNAVAKYKNVKNYFAFIKKQIYKEAPFNTYMWYLAPYTFAYRHVITGVFAAGIIGGILLSLFSFFIKFTFFSILALYFLLALISAIQQAKRYKKPMHIFTLPFSFFLYHFLHGLGILWGLLRLATSSSPVQKIKEPWDGYGSFRIKPNKK
jgi:glycosyltransferase involved in cell wall biosynthesis